MYYSDHLTVSETEIDSRNFCTLVDAAVMLYEEEEHRKEENNKRTFHDLPIKKRSSFVTRRRRRNPQASTSSLLRNLNSMIATTVSNTPNPISRSSPSSCFTEMINPSALETEKASLKGRASQETYPSSLQTEKARFNRRASQETSPNSLKTEKASLTQETNPKSLQTEKVSLKRRASQETNRAKKAKVVAPLSWKGRETPESLVQLMNGIDGDNPRLIFEKTLSQTDCDPAQSRLLMPFNSLIRNDFLTPVESRLVQEQDNENDDDNLGVGSILVDQRGVKWGVFFKRRDMEKKDSGKVNMNYALISGWSDMVKANGLKAGDNISVWSFRRRGLLCFALVAPPSTTHICTA